MYDAFISYSQQNRPLIRALREAGDRRGLRLFIDLESLRAGKEWPPQLGKAISQSHLFVLCWSQEAAASEWVRAELNQSVLAKKNAPALPWLIDDTPLPPLLGQTHGIRGTDPGPVVEAIATARRQRRVRRTLGASLSIAFIAAVLMLGERSRPMAPDFKGHVVDESGNGVPGAIVGSGAAEARTDANGFFVLKLEKEGAVHIHVSKSGYKEWNVDTRSDVPDFGVVLEKR